MIQILSEQFRDILRANTSSKKTEGWIVGLKYRSMDIPVNTSRYGFLQIREYGSGVREYWGDNI